MLICFLMKSVSSSVCLCVYLFFSVWNVNILLDEAPFVCSSVCLSVCTSVFLPVSWSPFCLFISLFVIFLSFLLSASLSVCLYLCLSFCPSVCLSLSLSIFLNVSEPFVFSVWLFVCLSHISVCLSFFPSACSPNLVMFPRKSKLTIRNFNIRTVANYSV
jgi:hypothetical protein